MSKPSLTASARCGGAQLDTLASPGRGMDLAAALRLAECVDLGTSGDVEGTGTTLVTARPGFNVTPSFGPASQTKQMHSGFMPLPVPNGSTVCRDVGPADHLTGPLLSRAPAARADAALR